MTLRFRLLFGYGYLVALVLVAAGSALLGFLQLSAGIGVVLEENVKSIGAAMRMIEALDGQHGGTLAALVEGRPPDAGTAADDRTFRDALAVALANVTEEAEPDVLAAIERDYAAYRRACEELLAARPERPVGAYEAAAETRMGRTMPKSMTTADSGLTTAGSRCLSQSNRSPPASGRRSQMLAGLMSRCTRPAP